MPSVSRAQVWAPLPPEAAVLPRPASSKVIVLDDDPTGTQTVHGIPVLTGWGVAALVAELLDPAPCCYVLSNTRAFPVARACAINREIGANLARAAKETGQRFAVVSRSDSTLRGHYPAETDALADALGGGFDGTLIVPAFLDGGRVTVGDIHYVADGDLLTPAGETEFARDASFGYRASNLREWVAEKTSGRIAAENVVSLSIEDLRCDDGGATAAQKLLTLQRGGVAVANAAGRGDLAVLTHALAAAEGAGRRYLFRTAADFVAAYAGITRRPLLAVRELVTPGVRGGGLLVAGSHVGRTSAQLDALFAAHPALVRVELAVAALFQPERRALEIARCIRALEATLAAGASAALYTSRQLIVGRDAAENLAFGETISAGLVKIVLGLAVRPRWLVAKGGITSSDIATLALGIRRATVLGQAMSGVPVWLSGSESKWPGLACIVFPGNVGGSEALRELFEKLEAAGTGAPSSSSAR